MAQEEELNFLYHFRREAEGDPVEIILIIQMRWDVSSASEGAGGRQPQFTEGRSCRAAGEASDGDDSSVSTKHVRGELGHAHRQRCFERVGK